MENTENKTEDKKQSFRGSQVAAMKEAFKSEKLFITNRPGFYNVVNQLAGSPEAKESGVREVKIYQVDNQNEDVILHDDFQSMSDFIAEKEQERKKQN